MELVTVLVFLKAVVIEILWFLCLFCALDRGIKQNYDLFIREFALRTSFRVNR